MRSKSGLCLCVSKEDLCLIGPKNYMISNSVCELVKHPVCCAMFEVEGSLSTEDATQNKKHDIQQQTLIVFVYDNLQG